jgi:hypothetical protein
MILEPKNPFDDWTNVTMITASFRKKELSPDFESQPPIRN